jgi:hypothetical protein
VSFNKQHAHLSLLLAQLKAVWRMQGWRVVSWIFIIFIHCS